jgi:single-stranded-DNA-specific exonuclease
MDVLDLVAVGTICDLMPLKNENRIIVKKGLKALNATARPGLKKLLLKLDLSGRKLTAKDVSWNIGPVINAAGRMGRPDVGVKLLLSEDPGECEGFVKELLEMNQERKKLGETAWNQALPEARKSFEEMKNKLVLVNGNQIHRGVTGIVASRLVSAFKVPAIVVSHVGDTAIGSMRSLRGLNARDFLAKFETFFNDFGGHDAAAGFNLPATRVDSLTRAIQMSMDEIQLDEDKVALEIDAELPHAKMTADLITLSEMLEPYGEANRMLEFLCKGMTVRKCDVIDKGTARHLSTMLEAGSLAWTAMWWNIPDDCPFIALKIGTKVDTVFKVQRNFFMNTEKTQLIISDMKLAQG